MAEEVLKFRFELAGGGALTTEKAIRDHQLAMEKLRKTTELGSAQWKQYGDEATRAANLLNTAKTQFDSHAAAAQKAYFATGLMQRQMIVGTPQARQALMGLSQVIQDMPFGIRGVANNIEFLTQALVQLKQTTGGGASMFAAIRSVLGGPAGLLIGMSTLMASLQMLPQLFSKSEKAAANFAKEMGGLADAMERTNRAMAIGPVDYRTSENRIASEMRLNQGAISQIDQMIALRRLALWNVGQGENVAQRMQQFGFKGSVDEFTAFLKEDIEILKSQRQQREQNIKAIEKETERRKENRFEIERVDAILSRRGANLQPNDIRSGAYGPRDQRARGVDFVPGLPGIDPRILMTDMQKIASGPLLSGFDRVGQSIMMNIVGPLAQSKNLFSQFLAGVLEGIGQIATQLASAAIVSGIFALLGGGFGGAFNALTGGLGKVLGLGGISRPQLATATSFGGGMNNRIVVEGRLSGRDIYFANKQYKIIDHKAGGR